MNVFVLTIKVLDHILFLQHLINHTSTEALQLQHKNHRTPCESSTPGQSLNAGTTVAMVDNSPPSATSFDINERSLASPASPLVRSAEQSSHELLLETGTWPMRSASKGETPIIKLAPELQIMQSMRPLLLYRGYFWSWSIPSHISTGLEIHVDILRRYDNYDTLSTVSYHQALAAERIGYLEEKGLAFFGGRKYTHTIASLAISKIHKVLLPAHHPKIGIREFFIALGMHKL
jgi:hypothetical protein